MIRIIFLHPPKTVQPWMLDSDGQATLDLNDNTTIALTKIIDNYADIGTIKQDNFNEFTVPITKKNRILFGPVGNPSALNINNTKTFMIQLVVNSFAYPAQALEITETNDKDSQYICTIFGEINDWYRPLSQLKLNELELGTDIVDYDYILAQNNFAVYQDGAAPVVAPLVNYGEWFVNTFGIILMSWSDRRFAKLDTN